MNEPKQIELFDRKLGRTRRYLVYVPPKPDAIDKFAATVCERIGQGKSDEQHANDLIRGFSTFIKVVVKINTKYLNKGEAA